MEPDFDLADLEDAGNSAIDEFDVMFVASIAVSLILFLYIFLFH